MIDYDPFSDAVMRDPWPFYAELRREAPVFYLEKYDTWFLSRFEDIFASTTKDLFTAERGVSPEMVLLKQQPPPDPVFSMLDMPRQRDYRRMFVPRYTRRAVAKMEDEIRTTVRQLLEPLLERGHFDVYRDLAVLAGKAQRAEAHIHAVAQQPQNFVQRLLELCSRAQDLSNVMKNSYLQVVGAASGSRR